jgi:hypothetical protein
MSQGFVYGQHRECAITDGKSDDNDATSSGRVEAGIKAAALRFAQRHSCTREGIYDTKATVVTEKGNGRKEQQGHFR